MKSKPQAPVGAWWPDWVEAIENESLHTDVVLALGRREMSIESGARRSPKRRALVQRGDALMARVEKRPKASNAMSLADDAHSLYAEAGDTVKRQPPFASQDVIDADKILAALDGILGRRSPARVTRALTLAAGLHGMRTARLGKLDRRALGGLYFAALRAADE